MPDPDQLPGSDTETAAEPASTAVPDLAHTAVFVNPAAGSGRAARVWHQLQSARPDLAPPSLPAERVILASGPGASRRALAELLETHSDLHRLIVVGGDGSVHLAFNALMEAGAARRVALGLVPAGTGSDLARTLRLPRRPLAALDHLLAATPRPFDLLQLDSDDGRSLYAANVASAGISGLVDLQVNAMRTRGHLAFLLATIQAIVRYQPVPCRVDLDGTTVHDGPLFLLAIGNGRYFGKGMKALPTADPTDGLAEVLLVRPIPRPQLLLRLPQIFLGTHLSAPQVTYRQAREIFLTPHAPLPPLDMDGETYPPGIVTLRIVPGAASWAG